MKNQKLPFLLLVSRDPSAVMPRLNSDSQAWRLETADSGWQALERVQSADSPDFILLDLGENGADGLHTLRWLRRVRPDTPVVLLARTADAAQKTEALRLGAKDYLLKPLHDADLKKIVERYVGSPETSSQSSVSSENIELVGDGMIFVSASPAMRELRSQAGLLAQINAPILMVGQPDSGKEIAARLIHKLSGRSEFQFLRVDCSALPADLLEIELFGKDRRDDARVTQVSPGKLDFCQKGTVYFDEITALPLSVQEKLVAVLHENKFSRVGSQFKVDCDLRIIAATQANLEESLADGKLREDLYFRLSAFTVYVPPVARRPEDVSFLLTHFMNQLSRHYDLPPRIFSTALLSACQRYPWPGNLKELENFAKRFLVVGDEELALTELERKSSAISEGVSIPAKLELTPDSVQGVDHSENGGGLKSLVKSIKGEAERNAIAIALEQTHWNRKAASRMLQVSYRTLLYKIQHYHLTPPESYLSAAFAGQAAKPTRQ